MKRSRLERELQRAQVRDTRARLFLEVDLRDEELHLLPDVGLQRRRRAARDAVAVLAQPGLEPVGLARGQDHDVVLADRVARLDGDAERLVALALQRHHRRGRGAARDLVLHPVDAARVGIEVLDEPRRAVRVDALEQLAVADADLAALEHRRHGHDQRELGQRALVVVGHADDGPVVPPDQDHLRRFVEQARVGLADVEAAEGGGGRRREGKKKRERDGNDEPRARACGKGCHGFLRW